MRRHLLGCVGWSVAGCLLGVALVAWAQESGLGPEHPAASWTDVTVGQVLAWLGLPITIGGASWQIRGIVERGLRVRVSLEPELVQEIRQEIRQALRPDPPPPHREPTAPP